MRTGFGARPRKWLLASLTNPLEPPEASHHFFSAEPDLQVEPDRNDGSGHGKRYQFAKVHAIILLRRDKNSCVGRPLAPVDTDVDRTPGMGDTC
jgi:hypothetical protein